MKKPLPKHKLDRSCDFIEITIMGNNKVKTKNKHFSYIFDERITESVSQTQEKPYTTFHDATKRYFKMVK